jgi:hypothetical protein
MVGQKNCTSHCPVVTLWLAMSKCFERNKHLFYLFFLRYSCEIDVWTDWSIKQIFIRLFIRALPLIQQMYVALGGREKRFTYVCLSNNVCYGVANEHCF